MFGSFDTPDFNLQPNPARHTLTLALNNLVDQATITITDITGKVVSQQNIANTDLINLPVQYLQSGMYFLTLTVQDAHTTQKFIKN
jgi:extracellular elastinolytic metalloproteinase